MLFVNSLNEQSIVFILPFMAFCKNRCCFFSFRPPPFFMQPASMEPGASFLTKIFSWYFLSPNEIPRQTFYVGVNILSRLFSSDDCIIINFNLLFEGQTVIDGVVLPEIRGNISQLAGRILCK